MSSTIVMAWLGALTGTVALGWDVVKWFKNGPRLRVTVRPNVWYRDAEVIKTEKNENGESTTYHTYNHIEVVNVGTMPTTILSIYVEGKMNTGKGTVSFEADQFQVHFGKVLPHVMGPGEVWSCRVRDERVDGMFRNGAPQLFLSVAHKKKPISIKLKKSAGAEK